MASNTRITRRKRQLRRLRAGRKRKRHKSRRSTLTPEELFAPLDERRDDHESHSRHTH